jgi:hypothetical protein
MIFSGTFATIFLLSIHTPLNQGDSRHGLLGFLYFQIVILATLQLSCELSTKIVLSLFSGPKTAFHLDCPTKFRRAWGTSGRKAGMA